MSVDPDKQAKREYSQLLRLHERLLSQLERMRDDLGAPSTEAVLREIKSRTGRTPELHLQEVRGHIEEAVRALELSGSKLQQELMQDPEHLSLDGVPNLPAHLARFLAERREFPGFSFDVHQDEVRGWVITWKEYTGTGTVRGYGQFYERPYAWLDE